ncbi:MAG: hypothetical protein ACUVRS_08785 [Armatimonadota bacterium]
MRYCEYWWTTENEQWCDVTNSKCSCEGSISRCPLGGKSLSMALEEEERITLKQLAMRTKRPRKNAEAL